jgi:hypothetical protein
MASGPRPEPSEPIKRLAASGLLPPDLASKFPKGQVAALAIISIEARGGGGICDLRIDEIATRSATGPSTVQSALYRFHSALNRRPAVSRHQVSE